MKYLPNNQKKGFTLIEMLIAVFIFTVSLAALMTVSAKGLRTANQAQQQITADYLALEGLEGVRNLRDSALLRQDDFNTWADLFDDDNCWSTQQESIGSSCLLSYGSGFTSNPIELYPCTTCKIFYNETNYLYRQFPGSTPNASYVDFGFTREIKFTPLATNNKEVIVTVIVKWDEGKSKVEYTENMFLWAI